MWTKIEFEVGTNAFSAALFIVLINLFVWNTTKGVSIYTNDGKAEEINSEN